MSTHNNALIATPFGTVSIAEYQGQLAIELLDAGASETVRVMQQSASLLVQQACQQVLDYLQNASSSFSFPASANGTLFQQRVWQAIAQIPCGQTRTYGQLAKQIGSGSRAVANACGANPMPLVIPCHRVVAQNGIGGFMQGKAHGLRIKQWLLQHEGVNGFGAK